MCPQYNLFMQNILLFVYHTNTWQNLCLPIPTRSYRRDFSQNTNHLQLVNSNLYYPSERKTFETQSKHVKRLLFH